MADHHGHFDHAPGDGDRHFGGHDSGGLGTYCARQRTGAVSAVHGGYGKRYRADRAGGLSLVAGVSFHQRHPAPGLGYGLRLCGADGESHRRVRHRAFDSDRGRFVRLGLVGRAQRVSSMSLETPLHRVEGLGSAHSGVSHFWRERVTAAALIPLSGWFVASVVWFMGKTEAEVAGYFQHPWNALLMGLFVIVTCVHMMLGLQVVIDDYVHRPGQRIVLLLLNRAFAWIVGGLSLVARLRLAVG